MSVDEAKEVSQDRNKWNKAVAAYPSGKKRDGIYACLLTN